MYKLYAFHPFLVNLKNFWRLHIRIMFCKFSRYQATQVKSSAMQATVTNMQVAVKYRRNVSSLSINMSADNQTTTLGRHIDQHIGRLSVDISTDAWPICRSICRRTHLGRLSVDISAKCRLMCRPTYWSIFDRYVDWYIGWVSVDMSTAISVEGWTKYTWSKIIMVAQHCHWKTLQK